MEDKSKLLFSMLYFSMFYFAPRLKRTNYGVKMNMAKPAEFETLLGRVPSR